MGMVLIYCLLFACSGSLTQTTSKSISSVFREIIEVIWNLEKYVQTDAEELHTPKDVQANCTPSAFRCFMNGTLFLKPAEGHNKTFYLYISRLKNFQCPNVSEQGCPSCASYSKHPPQIFLKDFITLLQRANRRQRDPKATQFSEKRMLECPRT